MLGLVATMIPMGPALKSLSDGNLAQVSQSLMVAFSAVIPGLDRRLHHLLDRQCAQALLAEELLEIQELRNRSNARSRRISAESEKWMKSEEGLPLKLLDETEVEDPILSVVNLIDIFLVIIAALLIVVAQNPMMNPFSKQDVTVITDAGKPNMEVLVKNGKKIEKYKSSGKIARERRQGRTAYRMKDGSIVYVPETENKK
jgi:hypothetical protein